MTRYTLQDGLLRMTVDNHAPSNCIFCDTQSPIAYISYIGVHDIGTYVYFRCAHHAIHDFSDRRIASCERYLSWAGGLKPDPNRSFLTANQILGFPERGRDPVYPHELVTDIDLNQLA